MLIISIILKCKQFLSRLLCYCLLKKGVKNPFYHFNLLYLEFTIKLLVTPFLKRRRRGGVNQLIIS